MPSMIACGTDTSQARDFVLTGLAITEAATALLLLLFSLSDWPWMEAPIPLRTREVIRNLRDSYFPAEA